MSDILSIYIHVPFCVKKCSYCDFFSRQNLLLIPDYIRSLIKEIKDRADSTRKVSTVYFGGGTPSLLSIKDIDQILHALALAFEIVPGVEVTLEVNPGTIDGDYLKQLKRLGVNRLSIGIQSFDDKKLYFLGRIHSVDQGKSALSDADRAGFDNIGFDLMYGLPFETSAAWSKDLKKAIEFNPAHLSCYMLTIEAGTELHADVKKGLIHPVPGKTLSGFFKKTSMFLTKNGYDHYEISNFSRGGRMRSKHNSSYWKMTPYLGFGPSAHSYDGGARFWNHSDINLYIKDILSGRLPVSGKEKLTLNQKMLEMILLALRTTDGLDLELFYEYFNIPFEKKFKDILDQIEKENSGSISNNCFSLNLNGRACLDSIVEAFAGRIV